MPAIRSFAPLILLLASFTQVQAQPADPGLVRFDIILPEVLPIRGDYQTYAEHSTLRVAVIVVNESSRQIQLDQARLRDAMSLRLFGGDGGELPVIARWEPHVRLSTANEPTATEPVGPVAVGPGASAMWGLIVERRDKQSFVAGSYAIAVTSMGFPMVVRTANGEPWQGRARDASGRAVLMVTPPRNASESSFMHIEAAVLASRRRDFVLAMQEYERAVAADPGSTRALAGLAGAYVGVRRYPEAIRLYEQVLRTVASSPEQVQRVSLQLAVVLVAVGDEVRAARALRDAGLPEDRVPPELDRLRQNATRIGQE